jgi:flagellar hook protein FlgE
MASLSSIGSSGLQAAQLRLDASANNVANMNTPGYRRQAVAQQAVADSAGVRATVQREQQAAGVALEKEAVEQMSATYAFKANLQTIKTQDEMMGSLLDVKACPARCKVNPLAQMPRLSGHCCFCSNKSRLNRLTPARPGGAPASAERQDRRHCDCARECGTW